MENRSVELILHLQMRTHLVIKSLICEVVHGTSYE